MRVTNIVKRRIKMRYRLRSDKFCGDNVAQLQKKYHCTKPDLYHYGSKRHLEVKAPRPNSVSKLEPFREILDIWIKNKLKSLKKRKRFPVRELFNYMKATQPDFSSSYSALIYYVAKIRQIFASKKGSFLTLIHEQHECQADFARFYYYDALGTETEGECVVLSFPNSGASYLQVFPGKSTESMLTGMQNIFYRIGCIPSEIWLDNDTCFVTTTIINKKKERTVQPLFQAFADHHGFQPIFMNTRCGHEKGAVEKAVGYLRHNLLVPLPVITDFNKFNKELLVKSESLVNRDHYRKSFHILERFADDKKTFLPLPSEKFACESQLRCFCDTVGCVRVGSTKAYFVNPKYANTYLNATLCYDRCIITAEDGSIAYNGNRLYRDQMHSDINWSLILPLIAKHPNSQHFHGFLRSLPSAVRFYLATAYPNELMDFVNNMVTVSNLAGIEKAIAVAEICVCERRLSKKDFMKTLASLQK